MEPSVVSLCYDDVGAIWKRLSNQWEEGELAAGEGSTRVNGVGTGLCLAGVE